VGICKHSYVDCGYASPVLYTVAMQVQYCTVSLLCGKVDAAEG